MSMFSLHLKQIIEIVNQYNILKPTKSTGKIVPDA